MRLYLYTYGVLLIMSEEIDKAAAEARTKLWRHVYGEFARIEYK